MTPDAEGATGSAPASGSGTTPARRGLWIAVQLLVAVVVVWFVVDRVAPSLEELGGVSVLDWTPAWGPFALSCGVLLLGYFLSGALWGRMVWEMGGGRLRVVDSIRVYMVANLGRYIPGKIWQIAGLALLARDRGVPARVATGAAVLGQGTALAAATLIGSVTLLSQGGEIGRVAPWIVAGIFVCVTASLLPPVARRLLGLWFRLARTEPPEGVAATPVFVLRWIGLYAANWGVYVLSFWMLVKSFDLPGSFLDTGPAFAAAYVLGYLALPVPGGLGVREGFLTAFLSPAMGVASAAVVAVVARVWATGVEVLPAGAFWISRERAGNEGAGPPPERHA